MIKQAILTPIIVTVSIVSCAWISNIFVRNLIERPPYVDACVDRNGRHHAAACRSRWVLDLPPS